MAESQNDHKTVLLLSPHRMLTDHQVVESLHIIKEKGKTDYIPCKPDLQEIKDYYSHLSKPAKEALICFTREGVRDSKAAIKIKFDKLPASNTEPYEIFFQKAITRRLCELFEPLKSQAAQVKW